MSVLRTAALVIVLCLISSTTHAQLDIIWQRYGQTVMIGELDAAPGVDVLEESEHQDFRVWDRETGDDKYTVDHLPDWFQWGIPREYHLTDLFADGRGELLVVQKNNHPLDPSHMGLMQLVNEEFEDLWWRDFAPDYFELAPVLFRDKGSPTPNDQAILCLFGTSGQAYNFLVLDLVSGMDVFDFQLHAGAPQGCLITEVEVLDVIPGVPLEIIIHYYDPNPARALGDPPHFTLMLGVDPQGTATTPVGSSIFLAPSTPNPSNNTTMIQFNVPEAGEVDLRIYNAAGRLVKTLVDRSMLPGRHDAFWDGRDDQGMAVSSGVYFYELRTNHEQRSRKMVRVK